MTSGSDYFGYKFQDRSVFAMDICKIKEPELTETKDDHFVGCHLYLRGDLSPIIFPKRSLSAEVCFERSIPWSTHYSLAHFRVPEICGFLRRLHHCSWTQLVLSKLGFLTGSPDRWKTPRARQKSDTVAWTSLSTS